MVSVLLKLLKLIPLCHICLPQPWLKRSLWLGQLPFISGLGCGACSRVSVPALMDFFFFFPPSWGMQMTSQLTLTELKGSLFLRSFVWFAAQAVHRSPELMHAAASHMLSHSPQPFDVTSLLQICPSV